MYLFLEQRPISLREEDQHHPLDTPRHYHLLDEATDDRGGALLREAVHAGRDGGERDALRPQFLRHPVTIHIGVVQEVVLAPFPAVPDRADGVDDPFGREFAGGRGDRAAGRQAVGVLFAPYLLALFEYRGAAGLVDGAVHAVAAEEGGVGGVHDGVDGQFGDVAGDDIYLRGHRFPPEGTADGTRYSKSRQGSTAYK